MKFFLCEFVCMVYCKIVLFLHLLFAVIPANAIQIGSDGTAQGLQTLTMTNAASLANTNTTPTGATIVQYAQSADGQFFIPGKCNVYICEDSK